MAAKEMYDYLGTISPDYSTTTLTVTPQGVIQEDGDKYQEVHEADDLSEEVVSISDASIFHCTLHFNHKQANDIGTIIDFYHDTAKANGREFSFKWDHPTDGHTYVVRFVGPLKRILGRPGYQAISSVVLKVLGRIAD